MNPDRKLDARGLKCPMPLVKAKKELIDGVATFLGDGAKSRVAMFI